MKQFRFLLPVVLAVASVLTGCLHIEEEVTFNNKGNGKYAMVIDMSEVKSMMEMFKGMAEDSTGGGEMPDLSDTDMGDIGKELSGVTNSLSGIKGISNVREVNDTAQFRFGYSFEFTDIAALNSALRVINKEKYDSKTEEIFRYDGKSFERLAAGDLGEEIKKALAEGEEEDMEGAMDMMKMFFGDMSYKQIYHFPNQSIKSSNNKLGEVSADGHTLTVNIKPFDEEQAKEKMTVATKLKLKKG